MKILKNLKGWLTDPITQKSLLIFLGIITASTIWSLIKDVEDFTQNFWKRVIMILMVAFISATYAYWVQKKRAKEKGTK